MKERGERKTMFGVILRRMLFFVAHGLHLHLKKMLKLDPLELQKCNMTSSARHRRVYGLGTARWACASRHGAGHDFAPSFFEYVPCASLFKFSISVTKPPRGG